MGSEQSSFKRFKLNTRELSQKEKALFEKLVKAAELLGPLYDKQKNNKYPGANFYPPDASREEIQKAAQNNQAILSPYTFVERDKDGELRAVPFHIKFKEELKKIAQLLKEAAVLSQDKHFNGYLKARADDLLRDNYDKSNILWLKTEKSKIGFVIGPFDRYLDKLFFKKRAYMAWVGILEKQETKEAERLKTMLFTAQRRYLPGAKKTEIPSIKVRLEDTALFSGLIADFMFVGNNLPSSADLYLVKKYGTMFTVFNPTVRQRFDKGIFPIFKAIFSKSIQGDYSKEELYLAHVRSIILHEACHSLMRYEDAALRLEEFFPFFDELYTDILGIKICGSILLKDGISQKELEALLIILVCRHLYWLWSVVKNPGIISYATGGAISLNFMLSGKTLKQKGRFLMPDLNRLFICVNQLSNILEYYIALGTRAEAREFIKKYGSFDVFQQHFLPKLTKISKR